MFLAMSCHQTKKRRRWKEREVVSRSVLIVMHHLFKRNQNLAEQTVILTMDHVKTIQH